jgi:hypothetical protein
MAYVVMSGKPNIRTASYHKPPVIMIIVMLMPAAGKQADFEQVCLSSMMVNSPSSGVKNGVFAVFWEKGS